MKTRVLIQLCYAINLIFFFNLSVLKLCEFMGPTQTIADQFQYHSRSFPDGQEYVFYHKQHLKSPVFTKVFSRYTDFVEIFIYTLHSIIYLFIYLTMIHTIGL
jgi:hypothetical protein